ncbi:hypothetical protein O6H91_23G020500 [Diphasiastrum complanatum]|uniref:Uncharacterized protein n=2 Tax=Diphasiastrum complanatum TaxID=34168 RepID=A0ACC2A8U6_DIPCM|nr:hypothetical protein O6H91_23G020500 [Diphasiastrum complanatum]KAJ7513957.1 hypothetical protein O6H91_23G020500 [Diphasiastrum complanatum]
MDFELHHHQQQHPQHPHPQQHASTSEATSHLHPHPYPQQQQQQSNHTLTLSLPIHSASNAIPPSPAKPSPSPAAGESERIGGGHGRDDCWSEGATFTLIDAWGERYLELNRGNLKQKHWQDVADAVNRRESGGKAFKTDVQCKNRLDTLKKKYKLEKSRIASEGSSRWPFLSKLEELIGSSKKGKIPQQQQQQQQQLPPPSKLKIEEKKAEEDANEIKPFPHIHNNKASTSSKDRGSAGTTDSSLHGTGNIQDGRSAKKRKWKDSPFKDLARAIIKFGEVYDKIESAKQQQLLELEKQRMEFTKDLELQRMQLFMQTQVELAKMKYSKHGSTEHYL